MDGLSLTLSLRAVEKYDRVEHRSPHLQGNARICEKQIWGQLKHATSKDYSVSRFLFALISSGLRGLVLLDPARQNGRPVAASSRSQSIPVAVFGLFRLGTFMFLTPLLHCWLCRFGCDR